MGSPVVSKSDRRTTRLLIAVCLSKENIKLRFMVFLIQDIRDTKKIVFLHCMFVSWLASCLLTLLLYVCKRKPRSTFVLLAHSFALLQFFAIQTHIEAVVAAFIPSPRHGWHILKARGTHYVHSTTREGHPWMSDSC